MLWNYFTPGEQRWNEQHSLCHCIWGLKYLHLGTDIRRPQMTPGTVAAHWLTPNKNQSSTWRISVGRWVSNWWLESLILMVYPGVQTRISIPAVMIIHPFVHVYRISLKTTSRELYIGAKNKTIIKAIGIISLGTMNVCEKKDHDNPSNSFWEILVRTEDGLKGNTAIKPPLALLMSGGI